MILRRLVEYAERMENEGELTPVMYGATPIRWQISLSPGGELEEILQLGGDRKDNKRGNSMTVPTLVRAAGIKPKLLADNGEYVLGVARGDSAASKVAERHRRFVELVGRCAYETEEPQVRAVSSFLKRWDAGEYRDRLNEEEFDPQDNLAFRVGGEFPADLPTVKAFWAEATTGEDAPVMTCLVTGKFGPVEERLPVKVKGLTRIGGQAAGTSLVSANAPAFESYGLEASQTSPISRDAGERFGKALNHLLADERSSIFIGPSAYVFWTREESSFDPILMVRPDPESVKLLLASPLSGARRTDVGNDFYALALSASGGRAVVRDWLETTVPEAQASLKRWFGAQRVVSARRGCRPARSLPTGGGGIPRREQGDDAAGPGRAGASGDQGWARSAGPLGARRPAQPRRGGREPPAGGADEVGLDIRR